MSPVFASTLSSSVLLYQEHWLGFKLVIKFMIMQLSNEFVIHSSFVKQAAQKKEKFVISIDIRSIENCKLVFVDVFKAAFVLM